MDLADELAAIFSAFGLSCELDGDGVLTSSPVAEEGLAASPFCVLLSVSDGVLKASSASAYRVPLAWRPALTRFLATCATASCASACPSPSSPKWTAPRSRARPSRCASPATRP